MDDNSQLAVENINVDDNFSQELADEKIEYESGKFIVMEDEKLPYADIEYECTEYLEEDNVSEENFIMHGEYGYSYSTDMKETIVPKVENKFHCDEDPIIIQEAENEKYTESNFLDLEQTIVTCINDSPPTCSRKRLKITQLWKSNKRKLLRESGKEYTSMKNKVVSPKKIKKVCQGCKLNCVNIFTAEDRANIFQCFWNMRDAGY